MGMLTKLERYNLLCSIKRNGGALSVEEMDFIQDYAWEKLQSVLEDPEVQAVFQRMKDQ